MVNSHIHVLLLQDFANSSSKQSVCKSLLTLYASRRSSRKTGVMDWYMTVV